MDGCVCEGFLFRTWSATTRKYMTHSGLKQLKESRKHAWKIRRVTVKVSSVRPIAVRLTNNWTIQGTLDWQQTNPDRWRTGYFSSLMSVWHHQRSVSKQFVCSLLWIWGDLEKLMTVSIVLYFWLSTKVLALYYFLFFDSFAYVAKDGNFKACHFTLCNSMQINASGLERWEG